MINNIIYPNLLYINKYINNINNKYKLNKLFFNYFKNFIYIIFIIITHIII